MVRLDIGRLRETATVALMVLLVGLAVYSFLGFAWTFKTAVEATQKVRRAI
jgi:preprotein translocase subunit SecF